MAESSCAKSCETCQLKGQLKCPGCRMGPGKVYGGECDIAKCCSTRGYQGCEECSTASTCPKLKRCAGAEQDRLKKREADKAERHRRYESSAVLGKWLMILFWVVIVSNVINFVLGFMEEMPGMKLPVELVGAAFGVVYGLILLMMSKQSGCLRISGISRIICVIVNVIVLLFEGTQIALWISLAALVPSYIAEYQEYIGYVQVTDELDEDLSRKWSVLWYWSLGGLIAMGAGLVLTIFGLMLGALAVLASSVLTIVVAVIKIVYLYRSAKMFREYVQENQYIV